MTGPNKLTTRYFMTVLKVSGKMTPFLDFCRRRRAGVDFCAKVDWRRRTRRVR
jgi:hypothetical protein